MNASFLLPVMAVSVLASAGDIPLREALAAARGGSPSVDLARSDLDAARARSSQAVGSLLPVVTASSEWSRLGPNLGGDPRSNAAARMDGDAQWKSVLGAKWTVFDGFRSWNALGSVSARQRASEAAFAEADLAAQDLAALRWSGLWLAGRRETMAESTLATSRIRRDISSLRRDVGAEAGLETRQSILDARRDSLALLRARASRLQASRALELAIGRKAEGVSTASDPGIPDTSDPLGGRSPSEPSDVRALREIADASGRELSAARSGWWPEFALFANHVWLGALRDADSPGDVWSQGMVYGATASWVLFEGGRTSARDRESAAARAKAAVALSAREREADGAIATARTRWETARTAWALESDNASQAAMVLGAALARYRSGDLSGLDLRRYQDSRDQAVLALDEARIELLLARIGLRRAAGMTPLES